MLDQRKKAEDDLDSGSEYDEESEESKETIKEDSYGSPVEQNEESMKEVSAEKEEMRELEVNNISIDNFTEEMPTKWADVDEEADRAFFSLETVS